MSFSESLADIVQENRNQMLGKHSSWERVRLGEVADILNGYPFASEQFSSAAPGTPLIRIRDILCNVTETYFCGGFEPEFMVHAGDLLIGMDGDFNSSVWRGKPGLLNQRCCKLSLVSPEYDPRLLAYCLPGYLAAINAHTSAITVKHLSSRTISEIPLPLPPLNEQRRIADMLNELLSDLDAGVATLERVQMKLKHYRATVLKAAVEGALTAEWRAQHRAMEPASALLTRILAERRRRREETQLQKFKDAGKEPPKNWKAKYQESGATDSAKLPVLPEGWCWATVDHLLAAPIINGISVRGTDGPPGIPALRLNAMSDRGFDYSIKRYLPLKPKAVDDLWITADDFFVSRGNGSKHLVGRGTFAQSPPEHIIFPDTMMRLRFIKDCLALKWISTIWSSGFVRKQIEKRAKTTAGIYKISQPDLAGITVPVPPLAEQEAIVEAVEDQLSVIDHLEADLEAKMKSSQALRQSILRHAFTGQLALQDPNDEPASELLKRIATQREELTRLAQAAK